MNVSHGLGRRPGAESADFQVDQMAGTLGMLHATPLSGFRYLAAGVLELLWSRLG